MVGNITRNQWLAITGVILSAIMTSTAFLTDSFGATTAHSIIGAAGFINMILNGVVAILTGQSQQVRDVAAMPGVQTISVNAAANQTLATLATSNTQAKVIPLPEAVETIKQTAKGD